MDDAAELACLTLQAQMGGPQNSRTTKLKKAKKKSETSYYGLVDSGGK
jgi:hypothetical protein